jgi:hypothetical protein
MKLKPVAPGADRRLERLGRRALERAGEGRCCAEAVILAVLEQVGAVEVERLAASARALCGGMGNREATCGVYTGGALALGFALEGAGKEELKAAAARFQEALRAEAGALACKALRQDMGAANEGNRLCHRLTARGAELVGEELLRREKE